jgi:hypothetical protein
MVIAALICFAILLVAWLLAPDRPRVASSAPVVREPEPQPLLEAA